MLESLEAATSKSIENLSAPKTAAAELDQKIAEMQAQIEEAAKIGDQTKRDDRMRVLTATLESLRREDEAEKRDFAEAVMGLDVLMNSIGGDFDNLMKPSASEQAILDGAQGEVQAAQTELAQAGQKTTWFGIRDRALTAANVKLEQAQTRLTESQARVKKMARERLMSADIEESMQQYSVMVGDRCFRNANPRWTPFPPRRGPAARWPSCCRRWRSSPIHSCRRRHSTHRSRGWLRGGRRSRYPYSSASHHLFFGLVLQGLASFGR